MGFAADAAQTTCHCEETARRFGNVNEIASVASLLAMTKTRASAREQVPVVTP